MDPLRGLLVLQIRILCPHVERGGESFESAPAVLTDSSVATKIDCHFVLCHKVEGQLSSGNLG